MNRAKTDVFKDTSHSEYDLEIRHLVESMGFAAFGKEYPGESMLHYALQNLRAKKQAMFNRDITNKHLNTGRKPCYKFNRDITNKHLNRGRKPCYKFNRDITNKHLNTGRKPCFKFNRESGCEQTRTVWVRPHI